MAAKKWDDLTDEQKRRQITKGITMVPKGGQPLPPELDGITVSWRHMDSEYAGKLLKNNTDNRKVSRASVGKYAQDMRSGAWRVNGDTVRIDREGTLLDGQHRATAVLQGSKTNPDLGFFVLEVNGLDPTVRPTIDTGRPRSLADTLAMRKEPYAATLAAVTKRAYLWEVRGIRWDLTRSISSMDAMLRYLYGDPDTGLESNAPLLRWAAGEGIYSQAELSGIMAPSTFGTMLYLTAAIVDYNLAVEFWIDGVRHCDNIPKSHPAQRLRKVLTRETRENRTTRHVDSPHVFAYCIKAWNEFVTGDWDDTTTIIAPKDGWTHMNVPAMEPKDNRDYPTDLHSNDQTPTQSDPLFDDDDWETY